MDIEQAIKDGIDRTNEKTGYVLIAVFLVISIVSTVASQSQLRNMDQLPFMENMGEVPFVQDPSQPGPLAFDLPSSLISLMNLGSSIAFIIAVVVAYRVFAADAREKIPKEAYTRDMGIVALNAIVASIIFGIAVAIGLFLLIIPGLYLLSALIFFLIFIAVEGESFIDSLKSSWELTKGRRLSVFFLLITLFVINIIMGVVGAIASSVVGALSGELGEVVGLAIGAAVSVFSFPVLLNAYYQLRDSPRGNTAGTPPGTDGSSGSGTDTETGWDT